MASYKFIPLILISVMIGDILLLCSCNDSLDIKNDYYFDLSIMPVQSKIMQDETVEIRCTLTREGIYDDAKYYIRYFQSNGTGKLKVNDGTELVPNDSYLLPADRFNLYYTSNCEEQQTFDIYITDIHGQTIQKTFNFQNEKVPVVDEPINYNFAFSSLPIPSQLLRSDTIEIRCVLTKEDERNNSTYSIRYFQPSGKGALLLGNDVLMQPNELYDIDSSSFRLFYISDCEESQTIDIYVVDSRGQIVQKTFRFENIAIEPEPEINMTFTFETLPVPKSISTDETVEIRCVIKKVDDRNTSNYLIRYFQPDGKGILKTEDGTTLLPNDLYPIHNQQFRLYYTSCDVVPQTIDIYIEDTNGQVVRQSFSFQHRPEENPDTPLPDDNTDDDTDTLLPDDETETLLPVEDADSTFPE